MDHPVGRQQVRWNTYAHGLSGSPHTEVVVLSSITINSNVASLKTQSALTAATKQLTSGYTRLSSGLRINRASDDAAGLAIAESLNVDARVFSQGLRNVNDGISAIAIAEGAVQELSSVVIRQKELAEQSANGVFSNTQREALNLEANALQTEFNRIVQSTQFNNVSLLTQSSTSIQVQGGFGSAGGVSIGFGSELAHSVSSGTFSSTVTIANGLSGFTERALYDLNYDGNLDLIGSDSVTNTIRTYMGTGNGSFTTGASYSILSAQYVAVGDINNDGNIDILTNGSGTNNGVLLGLGDGTFAAAKSAYWGNASATILADINGDSYLDAIGTGAFSSYVAVALGNSAGTFAPVSNPSTSGGTPLYYCQTGDFNGDGKIDIIGNSGSKIDIFYGNGNGTFKSVVSSIVGLAPAAVIAADINKDGLSDFIVKDGSNINIQLATGGGNFSAEMGLSLGGASAGLSLIDINDDGNLDLVSNQTTYTDVFFGNGDGSFKAVVTGVQSLLGGILTGDVDNDGSTDIVTSNASGFRVHLSDDTMVTTEASVDLTTRGSSLQALNTLTRALQDIDSELGSLGSYRSRLETAASVLQVSQENYLTARSQILDADIADETAKIVKNRILQQASAAILAQANAGPEIALKLLTS